MNYTTLGRSALKVSRVCMGCMGLGDPASGQHSWTVGEPEADRQIIERVAELAENRGVSMTEVSLAWLLTKTDSPVVGATKPSHVDGAVGAVELELTGEEIAYPEELYRPHAPAGVMAQNGKQKAGNVV